MGKNISKFTNSVTSFIDAITVQERDLGANNGSCCFAFFFNISGQFLGSVRKPSMTLETTRKGVKSKIEDVFVMW